MHNVGVTLQLVSAQKDVYASVRNTRELPRDVDAWDTDKERIYYRFHILSSYHYNYMSFMCMADFCYFQLHYQVIPKIEVRKQLEFRFFGDLGIFEKQHLKAIWSSISGIAWAWNYW